MTRTTAIHHSGDPCASWRTRARRLAIGVVGGVVLGACSATGTDPPGNAETDRIAQVVANAISHPRQESADGLVREALATNAGQDGRLPVPCAVRDTSLRWQLKADPRRASEVEELFVPEGPSRTCVELASPSRSPQRGWEQMPDPVGSPDGWGKGLGRFAARLTN